MSGEGSHPTCSIGDNFNEAFSWMVTACHCKRRRASDGLLRYRYRGQNPDHPDNVGLREAMRQRVPLVYFHGIVEGKYEAEYPVFIVGDAPESLTFTVSVDERRFASLGAVAEDPAETDIRRRYVTRTVQQRLHQQEFRERVLEAYRRHCAVRRLKQQPLLEAAHIVARSSVSRMCRTGLRSVRCAPTSGPSV